MNDKLEKDFQYWYDLTEEQIRATIFKFPIPVVIVKIRQGLKEIEHHENEVFRKAATRAINDFLQRWGA